MSYVNIDGLAVLTGTDEGSVVFQGTAAGSITRDLVIDIPDFTLLGTSFGASNINLQLPTIPANAVIVRATLIMTTAATSSGLATLTMYLHRRWCRHCCWWYYLCHCCCYVDPSRCCGTVCWYSSRWHCHHWYCCGLCGCDLRYCRLYCWRW